MIKHIDLKSVISGRISTLSIIDRKEGLSVLGGLEHGDVINPATLEDTENLLRYLNKLRDKQLAALGEELHNPS